MAFYSVIPAYLGAAPQTLADYDVKYQEETGKIAAAYSNELATAMGDYSNALDRALRDSKESGDLDGLLLLKKEIARVALQRVVPEETPEDANTTLLKLQNGYRQTVARAEASRLSAHQLRFSGVAGFALPSVEHGTLRGREG